MQKEAVAKYFGISSIDNILVKLFKLFSQWHCSGLLSNFIIRIVLCCGENVECRVSLPLLTDFWEGDLISSTCKYGSILVPLYTVYIWMSYKL